MRTMHPFATGVALFGVVLTFAFGTLAAEKRDLRLSPTALGQLQKASAGFAKAEAADLGAHFATALDLGPGTSLRLERSNDLPDGRVSRRFTQTFGGIPVWGETIVIVQEKSGKVLRVGGKAVYSLPTTLTQLTTALTEKDALQRVKEIVVGRRLEGAEPKYENETSRKVIYVDDRNQPHVAYEVSLFTTLNEGGPKPTRPVFLIDAATGRTLLQWDALTFADKGEGPGGNQRTGQYDYGANNVPHFGVVEQGSTCTMDSVKVFSEDLNHATSGNNRPFAFPCYRNTHKPINGAFTPLNDAQYFGQVVFNMFNDWYSRSPLTQKLQMRVHYGQNYQNAFWNGSSMTFGDGGTTFYPLVALDVSAHEVAHGFTEQNSGLIYRDQSGGINEAFSDMAGEAAEYYFFQKTGIRFGHDMPDYETGADIFKSPGQALRYLCDPPRDGRSIGSALNYRAGMDVHHSSGVFNKAFCVLSKNLGWGPKKTFDVFVAANQNYWTSSATFLDAAIGVADAADDLNYSRQDVVAAFKAVDIIIPDGKKQRYIRTTLRIVSNGNPRGCGYGDWNCMANLCKKDLGQDAWRGWAGCWKKDNKYLCNFECAAVRDMF